MQTSTLARAAALCLGVLSLVPAAHATPASGSPYFTDPVNEYVQDITSDGIANLNMVLCIMNAMSPADMLTRHGILNSGTGVTEVRYIALVDKNKCDSRSRASASNSSSDGSGATSTPDYMTAVVDISRGSNSTDPMVGKIWISMAGQGGSVNVSVRMTASAAPSTLPPYGRLRLDYVGYAGAQLQFNGFVDANGATVNHVETGQNSSNVALALNAVDTTSGSGVIQSSQNTGNGLQTSTYTFAYNSAAFARRVPPGADQCFDRSKASAARSVWRYGVYDATSGLRVDQNHPGFALTATTGNGLNGVTPGQPVFGYASYWGVNFGGVDPSLLPNLPDGAVTAFTNITDARPNNATTYSLFKNSGKLTQWTQHTTSLGLIAGVPFNFFGEGCKLVNGGGGAGSINSPSGASCAGNAGLPSAPDYRNWVMQWDSALQLVRGSTTITGNFKVVGMQDCSSGSCLVTTLQSPVTVQQGFKQMPINAWSDALGNITIPLPTGDSMQSAGPNFHADADPVYYYSQSTVLPGTATLSLYCLSNCPTSASLQAVAASSANSPFASPTNQQWGSGTSQQTYTFGSTGLLDGTASQVVGPPLTSGQWQGGVNSGRLFDAPLNTNCPTTYCEPPNPSTYYTYQTGDNQWNQTMWLTTAGTTVTFDPPQVAAYTVPSATAYGTWAGKTVQLQFNGFGNLNGIPGNCVDPMSNQPVSCSSNARFVPAFAIPDGTLLTIGSQSVITKALDAELRLSSETCPGGLSTNGVSVSLPSALPGNPTLQNDATYIGAAPALSGAPAVIDGVLQ